MREYLDELYTTKMWKAVIGGMMAFVVLTGLCLYFGIGGYRLVVNIKNVLMLMGISKDVAFAIAMQSYVPLQLTVIGGFSILAAYMYKNK